MSTDEEQTDPRSLEGVIADGERRIKNLTELDDLRDTVLIDRMLYVLKCAKQDQDARAT